MMSPSLVRRRGYRRRTRNVPGSEEPAPGRFNAYFGWLADRDGLQTGEFRGLQRLGSARTRRDRDLDRRLQRLADELTLGDLARHGRRDGSLGAGNDLGRKLRR